MKYVIYSAEDLEDLKHDRLISKTQYRKFKQILNTTSFDYPKEIDTVRQVIRTISPLENAVGESNDDMSGNFIEKLLDFSKKPLSVGFIDESATLLNERLKESWSISTPTERVSHYKGTQAIDVAMEWELDTPLGNVLKYIQRNGKKAGESAPKDLVKAIDYILIHLGYRYPALREDVEMLRDQMSDMQNKIKKENVV